MLIEQCETLDEMPDTVKNFLEKVAADMALPKLDDTDGAGDSEDGPDDPDPLDFDFEDIL